jgi:signal peptidase I
VREVFEFAIITIIMAIFGMTFIVQGMKVPTGSMQNTINIGDHLLVNKFDIASRPFFPLAPQRDIRRGDVIVFKYPGNKYAPDKDIQHGITPLEVNYVKRVVGVPGDRIEIDGSKIRINGRLLDENVVIANDPCSNSADSEPCHNAPLDVVGHNGSSASARYSVYYEPGPQETSDSYPIFQHEGDGRQITVPSDSYFVMGDNRDNSEDSRYWGFVRRELVIGNAMVVYWSYDESAESTGNPLVDFFKNSRWSRSGTMVR